MVIGEPFEVSKEVYDRAVANTYDNDKKYFYMTDKDTEKLFSDAIRRGYGLYDCKIHEENGKYICTWKHGNNCD